MPDPLYADSVFGVWPDTLTNFPVGQVDVAYFVQVDVIVPATTADVPGLDLGFDLPIDSGQIVDVAGLPDGLTFDCNSHTPASCTFLPGVQGCGTVTGTPTETGTFVLDISMTAYLNILGSVISEDVVFSGYRIIVSDSTVSLEENGPLQTVSQNVPNPFATSTRIDYRLTERQQLQFRVLDLLGQEVFSQMRQGEAGRNSFAYTPQGLRAGVYLYVIETPEGRITKRMVYRP